MRVSKSFLLCTFVVLVFSITIFSSALPISSQQPELINAGGIPRPPGPDIGSYSSCSAAKHCPMGVADYGVNGATQYSYVAEEFQSWVNFTTLTIGGDGQMSVQQNTVDYKVHEKGHAGEYWIQDVPGIVQSGSSYTIYPLDNIWNMSSTTAKMNSKIYGNLNGACASTGGHPKFYYCFGKQTYTVSLPFELRIVVQTGIATTGAHAGSSAVTFAIYVYQKGVLVGGSQFDAVAFAGSAKGTAANFKVGGFNPYGLNNDAETVFGGNGGGSNIVITSVNAHISESYSTSIGGTFTLVPHAWSAGSDTAETVKGVHMKSTTAGTGIAVSGNDNNVQLW